MRRSKERVGRRRPLRARRGERGRGIRLVVKRRRQWPALEGPCPCDARPVRQTALDLAAAFRDGVRRQASALVPEEAPRQIVVVPEVIALVRGGFLRSSHLAPIATVLSPQPWPYYVESDSHEALWENVVLEGRIYYRCANTEHHPDPLTAGGVTVNEGRWAYCPDPRAKGNHSWEPINGGVSYRELLRGEHRLGTSRSPRAAPG